MIKVISWFLSSIAAAYVRRISTFYWHGLFQGPSWYISIFKSGGTVKILQHQAHEPLLPSKGVKSTRVKQRPCSPSDCSPYYCSCEKNYLTSRSVQDSWECTIFQPSNSLFHIIVKTCLDFTIVPSFSHISVSSNLSLGPDLKIEPRHLLWEAGYSDALVSRSNFLTDSPSDFSLWNHHTQLQGCQ